MTSTRLPGKVLADVCGQPALELMLSRVVRAKRLEQIVVATTSNETDDPVAQLCRELDVEVFRGGEADVLGRYAAAADRFDADPVVRLTADCPMIEPSVIDRSIAEFFTRECDYISNGLVRTYPDGLDVEVFSRAALDRAAREAKHPFSREHVTPYIKAQASEIPEIPFDLSSLEFEANFSHVRWTLDTPEDLILIRNLVAKLPPDFTWLQALAEATRDPSLLG